MNVLEDLEDMLENAVVDFHGQFHSTVAMWVITSLFGLAGLVYGYKRDSFFDTVKFVLAGTAVSFLVCALPWPFYSRHKIQWKKRPSD